jgi:hypothetical protein
MAGLNGPKLLQKPKLEKTAGQRWLRYIYYDLVKPARLLDIFEFRNCTTRIVIMNETLI